MKLLCVFFPLIISLSSYAQDSVGIFPFNQDIGSPKIKGSAKFDTDTQIYTLKGSGKDVWNDHDEFHYLSEKVNGDFVVTANFKLSGIGGAPERKTGWMIRAEATPSSAQVNAVVHGNGLTVLQWRSESGARMLYPQDEAFYSKRNVQTIQLERRGNIFVMRVARYGEPLQIVGFHQMKNMGADVLAGLFVCAHDSNELQEAKVWNVRIEKPVPATYDPNRVWRIVSRLETMDVFNGNRRVVYTTKGRIESPVWMARDKKILFSQEGHLYTLLAVGGSPEIFNTPFTRNASGAHCISPDGKMLGISGSNGVAPQMFFVPVKGGELKTITTDQPAWIHGISPDNKDVIYVAPRKDLPVLDIYKQPLSGGNAVPLTASNSYELADGCEYSPDGKYIYYNASQDGGTMQIWRMNPDGSDKEQLTFGAYNNWFPHISPDGKWMVFISFPSETALNTHPLYAPVMIRLMPVNGGAPKVIAYVYGGQGTLDENSWSPDSRHISFVSYTTM